MRVLLINPNTNATTTAMMLSVARSMAPADWEWLSLTAARGAALIDCEAALHVAAAEVAGMASQIRVLQPDAVIVAAFGDPGLEALRLVVDMPVFGIGESAMLAAHALALPYSVLTVTPKLRASTLGQIRRYGCDKHFKTLVITTDDAAVTTGSADVLIERVKASIAHAIHEDGAQVLIIGGGPVAAAARSLGNIPNVIVIQPLMAAINKVKGVRAASSSIPC
ncbi:MAG: aspartate/glutamate racemase family protein [Rhodocyclaceae bacterium]